MTTLALLLAATTLGSDPGLAWKQTDSSLALARDDRVVWQFNYPKEGKPYFHPLTIAGGPTLTDFRPADHPWHRALWFSWKTLNGLLYWEEDATGKSPGVTEVTGVKATPRADHSAHIEVALSYHPPGQPPVLTEKRLLDVSAPTADGTYHIDWLSTFTASNSDVLLDRTPIAGEPNGVSYGGYAGLSLRLSPALKTGQFSDREGTVKAVTKKAPWIAFSGPVDDRAATIAVLEHPSSFRHPTPWYLIQGMPYYSPAVLYLGPHTLPAGKSLALRYRILLQPGVADRDGLQEQWARFARGPAETGNRIRVLLLSGSNNHDWRTTTPKLKSILEASGRFTVDVTEHPETLTAKVLEPYDVIFSNWNLYGLKNVDWPEATRAAYLDFVRAGKGHVVVHAGACSFYNWPEYHDLTLAHWELNHTSHGPYHEFEVRAEPVGHPITAGLGTIRTKDELWNRAGLAPRAKAIASSFSSKETGGTDRWEPSALVAPFGNGRSFTLLLGHDAAGMDHDVFRVLITRGTEWAATGKVSQPHSAGVHSTSRPTP
jgi:type 1 glutamine amidotransferase